MATILLIDKDPILLDLISNTLRLDGHSVTALGDRLTALKFLAAGQLAFDLLLTDIGLPPITGFEFVKRLGKSGFRSPVLFMAESGALTSVVAQSLGSSAILMKPFTSDHLRCAVSSALTRHNLKIRRAA